jgi:uncharacterized membrane protein HdeD (DUF308 family)
VVELSQAGRPEHRSTIIQGKGSIMIILGIVLLIAGFLLKISILWTLGIVALVVGAILAILGTTGRAIGGRRHYF